QLVELPGSEPRHAAREHLRFPQRHRQRQTLQRDERLAQRCPTVDPVPVWQEAAERGLLRRLDLLPQHGERGATQAAQHIEVAPFPLGSSGTKLAADEQLAPPHLPHHRPPPPPPPPLPPPPP